MSSDPKGIVRVRRMSAEDIDAILRIVEATPEAPHWNRSEYEKFLLPGSASTPSPLSRLGQVAEWHGQVHGFVVVRLLRSSTPRHVAPEGPPEEINPTGKLECTCELESIVVEPSARRHGIGTLLMNATVGLATELRAGRLELEVRASNEAAIRLYTRAGLLIEGRRPGYYSQPKEDAMLMGMEIHRKVTANSD